MLMLGQMINSLPAVSSSSGTSSSSDTSSSWVASSADEAPVGLLEMVFSEEDSARRDNCSGCGNTSAHMREGPLSSVAYAPIQLVDVSGSAVVVLPQAGAANHSVTLLTALVPLSTPSAPPSASPDASLVSGIVAVGLLDSDDRFVTGGIDAATLLGTLPVSITFALTSAPGAGNASCVSPRLFTGVAASESCVAGCCIDGRCHCKPGFAGDRCELELRCFSAEDSHGAFSTHGCSTAFDGVDHVHCACPRLGYFAVVQYRLSPMLNLDLSFAVGRVILRQLQLPGWTAVLATYAVAMLYAFFLDQRTLYMDSPPHWLRPDSESMTRSILYRNGAPLPVPARSALRLHEPPARLLLLPPSYPSASCIRSCSHPHLARSPTVCTAVRTRTTLLRSFFVAREYTLYTRSQLTHCLTLNLGATALTVALLFGRQVPQPCPMRACYLSLLSL